MHLLLLAATAALSATGFFRDPAIYGDTVVFTAEGDLWTVATEGGVAHRLTTHLGQEHSAAISPDGTRVAFTASYEGQPETWVMPLEGGRPTRLSWEGTRRTAVVGWTPEGEVVYRTRGLSTLPDYQLVTVHPDTLARERVPLIQAAQAAWDGETLYFTRLARMSSRTKRYVGGSVENLWRYSPGDDEAMPLTADYPGASSDPMWHQGRLYFLSDRDGTRNLWSMNGQGGDLQQHTQHTQLDIMEADLDGGRVVYRRGADLYVYDLESGADSLLEIQLPSDLDQTRRQWVDQPLSWTSAAHLSPSGDRVVLTARGQVFVVPVGKGRVVEASRAQGVRYRAARFLDEDTLVALSDESGEVEAWTLDAAGLEDREQRTEDGDVLRFDALPSPDGRWLAWVDKDDALSVHDLQTRQTTVVLEGQHGAPSQLSWSPDSRYLAYGAPGANWFVRLHLFDTTDVRSRPVTTGRTDDYSPAWSRDGRWLAFLSDRNLVSTTRSPWGSRQPEPYLDHTTQAYLLDLKGGQRSPWAEADELYVEPAEEPEEEKKGKKKKKKEEDPGVQVQISWEGLAKRLIRVPLEPDNYTGLSLSDEHLYVLSWERKADRSSSEGMFTLHSLALDNGERDKAPERTQVMDEVSEYELSADGKQLLVRKEDGIYVFAAGAKGPDPAADAKVDLSGWSFSFEPREEWAQMYTEAWRLERDYFWDQGMSGVDWEAMRARYQPLADRVTDRQELADVLGQLISELETLHMFVYGGDHRSGDVSADPAGLGARLVEVEDGWRVDLVYQSDPDLPDELSPLARPGVDVVEGDVILEVDGLRASELPDLSAALLRKAGQQVRLEVRHGKAVREVIVRPLSTSAERSLRYRHWEYTRRLRVEEQGQSKLGYVHLRAMGGGDFSAFARDYYATTDRPGLILDVRHNNGGNIDSWLLSRLSRQDWMYWQGRVGEPTPNMQYAYPGHMVVLVDSHTASDGEAFAEGFRRLGLGPVLGTRTWGGEIWLSSSNSLVDRGIATAAEYGVYGPEGTWLIEGHGVEPDVVVDNLPHATFQGEDAQLDAAIELLLEKIEAEPVGFPPPPAYPVKGE